jgi:ubiquinone/menaquinone biosynthesis C-methylase UbiE
MRREPEPELMDAEEQARAYSEADFSEPHERFVDLFAERFPGGPGARVLDLGCGPADVTVRFARRFREASVWGVDGAEAMLVLGRRRVAAAGLEGRVTLERARLPDAALPDGPFETVISNSLLHHLADPGVLWREIALRARAGAALFVMDLMRPDREADARRMVEQYAAGEPEVLRRDFFQSLRAAYRPDEVRGQLSAAGLAHLAVELVSDRHLIVFGRR